MNSVSLTGRLTHDPEIRYGGASNTAVATYDIAVERHFKREGEPEADFFRCTSFGKTAEFVGKYFTKGMKVEVNGEVRNDNYTNKEGKMVYGTKMYINTVGFAESKKASQTNTGSAPAGGSSAPAAQNNTTQPVPEDAGADMFDWNSDESGTDSDGSLPFN